jgi:hypothetical protein
MTLPLTAARTAGHRCVLSLGIIGPRLAIARADPLGPLKIAVPAKAGTHRSTVRTAGKWIPAFAGMTIFGKPE